MQHHWEDTLNAKSALEITGDKLPEHESAVVISVCRAVKDLSPAPFQPTLFLPPCFPDSGTKRVTACFFGNKLLPNS